MSTNWHFFGAHGVKILILLIGLGLRFFRSRKPKAPQQATQYQNNFPSAPSNTPQMGTLSQNTNSSDQPSPWTNNDAFNS